MNKKLIAVLSGMVLLFGGAFFMYNKLSDNVEIKNETKQEASDIIDFRVYNENGDKVYLSDYLDKPVVINFWASWCTPCKVEMEYFNEATKNYGEDVNILMVNLTDGDQETVESATKYLIQNGFDMNVLFDKDLDATSSYQVMSIPRTIFIKDNMIVDDGIGTMKKADLFEKIENLIN